MFKTNQQEADDKIMSLSLMQSQPLKNNQMRNLMGTLFSLVTADGVITNYLVTQGIAREWNPFLYLVAGNDDLLWLKIGGALISLIFIWNIYRKKPKLASVTCLSAVFVYTGIVYWNVFTYFMSRLTV